VYDKELGLLIDAARLRNHRATVVCEPRFFDDVSWILDAYDRGYYSSVKTPTVKTPPNASIIRSSSYGRVLGDTVDYVVYDAVGAYDPNGFAALSDTVRGGGLFLLIVDDSRPPVYHQFDPRRSTSVIVPRFIRNLKKADLYAVVGSSSIDTKVEWTRGPTRIFDAAFRSLDQERVYRSAIEWFTEGGEILVIHSRRGRGKSALLGMVLRDLCLSAKIEGDVYVTSQSPQQLTALVNHLGAPFSGPLSKWGTVVKLNRARVVFVPPSSIPQSSTVFIDEASSVPLTTLMGLVKKASRVIVSATTYGYEGSGKSFQTVLLNWMLSLKRKIRVEELHQPVRYADGDPLEQAVTKTFMFFGGDSSNGGGSPITQSEPKIALFRAPNLQLMGDEELAEIYGVLTEAHYRNEPRDLSFLLENLDSSTFVYNIGSNIVGVALCVEDGPLAPRIAEAVLRGASFPGNLISERLTVRATEAGFAGLAGQRIVRIAIKPGFQGRGHGSALLKAVEASFEASHDWIGASFSADPRTLRFWSKNGYLCCAMSWANKSFSQYPSVICVKPLSHKAQLVLDKAIPSFRRQIAAQIYQAKAHPAVYAVIVKSLAEQGTAQLNISTNLVNFAEWDLPAELVVPEVAENLFALARRLTMPETESLIRLLQWRATPTDRLRLKAAVGRILRGTV
jgi:tRNA(Met) cytidine acetyltransferase